jgi:hypothetical protein
MQNKLAFIFIAEPHPILISTQSYRGTDIIIACFAVWREDQKTLRLRKRNKKNKNFNALAFKK